MHLELNNKLDIDALAKDYAKKQRCQVQNFFKPQSAEHLYQDLRDKTPWGLVYNNDPEVIELSHEMVRNMSPADIQKMYNSVFSRAKNRYQYLYYYYPIVTSYMSGENRDFFLHKVLEFINSEPMLDFVKKLTGFDDLTKGSALATLFQKNTFNTLHHDEHTPQGWRCAYVINLTKTWSPDWGGYLQFFDDNEDIEDALLPTFNAINIFSVPQAHAVSYIPAYVQGQRFSITGWFHST